MLGYLEFIFDYLLTILGPLIPSYKRVPGTLLWKIDVARIVRGALVLISEVNQELREIIA